MILVTGATGQHGRALLRLLSQRGIAARALVRDPARAAAIAMLPRVEIINGDKAHPETLVPALRGIERAILISSPTPEMLQLQSNFIGAARSAGVKHVVKFSGIAPNLDSSFRFARTNGEIGKRLEASGMTSTHLRPGEFMTVYFRQVPNIMGSAAPLLRTEDAGIASIDIGDIAAKTLTQGGHENQIYSLTGPEALTMAEVAARHRLQSASRSARSMFRRRMHGRRSLPPACRRSRQMRCSSCFPISERRKGIQSKVWLNSERLLGRRPTSSEQLATNHVAALRGEAPPSAA